MPKYDASDRNRLIENTRGCPPSYVELTSTFHVGESFDARVNRKCYGDYYRIKLIKNAQMSLSKGQLSKVSHRLSL
jgi:hypothetical protein